MTDKLPPDMIIYDRKILIDGSMVYVDKYNVVVGVTVSGDFPKDIVIGQQLPLAQRLEMEYLYQGVTDHALIIALWEKLIENKPDLANALQIVRDKVKHDINDLVS
jgi:hypothetical protein